MKKIDAHLHLVRDLASYKGNGRSNALGNGLVVWDSGIKPRLSPAGVMTLFEQTPPGK
ncbi:amidohydrolase [Lactobacillus delbrueckii subsp. delbrueckii DSM 20074 = JCM 1012]|nr:amidohydrolase [Lactobacillus delbrueckii subsp. delbrueckii DSM 20074 = JCM 1012]